MEVTVTASDSQKSVVEDDGIGQTLSKEDWKRLLDNDWLTDKVNIATIWF